MYENATPLDSTPDIKDVSPAHMEEKENDVKKEKTPAEEKLIINMQKARRGKPYIGGGANIRKLQNATVCIEKSKCSEEQVEQQLKGKVEESKKEQKSDKTKENEHRQMKGKTKRS